MCGSAITWLILGTVGAYILYGHNNNRCAVQET